MIIVNHQSSDRPISYKYKRFRSPYRRLGMTYRIDSLLGLWRNLGL